MMKKNFRTYTESGTCLPDGSSPIRNHYERGSAGKIRACACLTALSLLFSQILSERRIKIKLAEKEYTKAVSALEIKNQELKKEINNSIGGE